MEPTLADEQIDMLSPEEFEGLAAEGKERFDTLVDDLQSLAWKQKAELLSAALDDDEWRKLQKEAEDYVAHLDGITPDAQLILDLMKYLTAVEGSPVPPECGAPPGKHGCRLERVEAAWCAVQEALGRHCDE